MKSISLLIIAILCVAGTIYSQSATEAYMKRIPALPRDTCNISRAAAGSWEQQISLLANELDKDIESRKRNMDDYMEKNRETMQNNIINQMQQQTGLSNEDIEKMKNSKNMSKEERLAMANQMMMQQTNISMAEAQNLSKMSEAGKKAWAEGYAAEAQANAQANPKKQTTGLNVSNLMALQTEQQNLLGKITAEGSRIVSLYTEVENDPSGKAIRDKIEKLSRELNGMGTIIMNDQDMKKVNSLTKQIRDEQTRYCNIMTPKYRAVLPKHLASLKASMPDYRRFAEITSEINKAQTGVGTPPESHEITSMEGVLDYLGRLKDAYKYNLHYAEDLK